jgi:alpha-1,3/alpha-1,6-mannosyltransferase
MERLHDEDMKLIMAGGYDERVFENVDHFKELTALAEQLGISNKVQLLKSPSDATKVDLLRNADGLLYTPSGEHFGIVPIEAMYNELPVIAVNNGGPTETVVNGETGFLCEAQPSVFADAMEALVNSDHTLKKMLGTNGHSRVLSHFSFNAFASQLDTYVNSVMQAI